MLFDKILFLLRGNVLTMAMIAFLAACFLRPKANNYYTAKTDSLIRKHSTELA